MLRSSETLYQPISENSYLYQPTSEDNYNLFLRHFNLFKETLLLPSFISKKTWDHDKYIQSWCTGFLFNFAKKNQPKDMRAIHFDDLLSIFRDGLVYKHDYLVNALWAGNKKLLPAWYGSQPVNYALLGKQTEDMLDDLRIASFEDIINFYLTFVLPSQNTYIIEEMWNKNMYLELWFCRTPINFAKSNQKPNVLQLSLENQIQFFIEKVLPCRSQKLTQLMLNKNVALRSYLLGKPTNFAEKDQQEDLRMIPFNDLMSNFQLMERYQCHFLTKLIWDNNDDLRLWYSREPVKYTGMNDSSVTTLDKLLLGFESALLSEDPYIIDAKWNANATLRILLCGKSADFSKNGYIDFYSLPSFDLIKYFEKAVICKACPLHITKAMMESKKIQEIILAMNEYQFASLSEKISASNNPELAQRILELTIESQPKLNSHSLFNSTTPISEYLKQIITSQTSPNTANNNFKEPAPISKFSIFPALLEPSINSVPLHDPHVSKKKRL